jgi:cytochrome bd-type quinol oxidase subunit 2
MTYRGIPRGRAIAIVAGGAGAVGLFTVVAVILLGGIFEAPPVDRETDDHLPDDMSNAFALLGGLLALAMAVLAGLAGVLGTWIARRRIARRRAA